jgi:hypothetical protein
MEEEEKYIKIEVNLGQKFWEMLMFYSIKYEKYPNKIIETLIETHLHKELDMDYDYQRLFGKDEEKISKAHAYMVASATNEDISEFDCDFPPSMYHF